jgi:hypothetical protein
MPSVYQKTSLNALLALFLEAQGHPLPQQTQVKSASSLSRFLNIYNWSTRHLIRTTRQAVLQQIAQQHPPQKHPLASHPGSNDFRKVWQVFAPEHTDRGYQPS